MIINYRETSEVIEIHSDPHTVCTHDVEDGWECSCSECRCEAVIKVSAGYAYKDGANHAVIVEVNPSQYHGRAMIALPANVARALASHLSFAANDADTLDKEFPA